MEEGFDEEYCLDNMNPSEGAFQCHFDQIGYFRYGQHVPFELPEFALEIRAGSPVGLKRKRVKGSIYDLGVCVPVCFKAEFEPCVSVFPD